MIAFALVPGARLRASNGFMEQVCKRVPGQAKPSKARVTPRGTRVAGHATHSEAWSTGLKFVTPPFAAETSSKALAASISLSKRPMCLRPILARN